MAERHSDIAPARALRKARPDAQEVPKTLEEAREAVQGCRRCPLYRNATQAVFGEGPDHADVMFVGEQPGDQEDRAGLPFVGPAGKVFDAAMTKAGIRRDRVYVTNAVKHFKFEPRGKRRLHQRPDAGEIQACRFWLDLEQQFVRPRIVVALGATAARALLGKTVTISKLRGTPIDLPGGALAFVTNHPSYLLRIRDRDAAALERQKFEADLALVREHMVKSARRAAAGA